MTSLNFDAIRFHSDCKPDAVARPKLGRYQGPLSVPTGRKMPPHDRQPHFSYRYNADGSVRIKFPVKAAEVNGGAKARNGLQISKLKVLPVKE